MKARLNWRQATKLGLALASPVMLAGGSVGYGEARHREMELGRFGGVVVGPFTRR